jgi:threonyl-tRNA synthetase
MPDLHTFCADIIQATEEFKMQFITSMKWMEDLNLDHEVAIRFVKDFFEKNDKLAIELAKLAGKPILIELWDEKYFYFVMKFEFNIIDSVKKASALSTVQIDVENAERFDINYADEKGNKKYPYILHTSISGSIDRCLYAILERESIKMEKGIKPMLPLWLSPTQIRFIPVKDEYITDCKNYINQLNEFSNYHIIRTDIDDRDESVSRKIRDAEKEWIPIIIVIGDKERENKLLEPRFRDNSLGNIKSYSLKELYDLIIKLTDKFPQQKIPLSLYLSKRPRFK